MGTNWEKEIYKLENNSVEICHVKKGIDLLGNKGYIVQAHNEVRNQDVELFAPTLRQLYNKLKKVTINS